MHPRIPLCVISSYPGLGIPCTVIRPEQQIKSTIKSADSRGETNHGQYSTTYSHYISIVAFGTKRQKLKSPPPPQRIAVACSGLQWIAARAYTP
jgi:hypothetical protein